MGKCRTPAFLFSSPQINLLEVLKNTAGLLWISPNDLFSWSFIKITATPNEVQVFIKVHIPKQVERLNGSANVRKVKLDLQYILTCSIGHNWAKKNYYGSC